MTNYDIDQFALSITDALQRADRRINELEQTQKQTLRDSMAMNCPIPFTKFERSHYEEMKDYTPQRIMFEYCEMRYIYADQMLEARNNERATYCFDFGSNYSCCHLYSNRFGLGL